LAKEVSPEILLEISVERTVDSELSAKVLSEISVR